MLVGCIIVTLFRTVISQLLAVTRYTLRNAWTIAKRRSWKAYTCTGFENKKNKTKTHEITPSLTTTCYVQSLTLFPDGYSFIFHFAKRTGDE